MFLKQNKKSISLAIILISCFFASSALAAFNRPLSLGQSGSDVRELQQLLKDQGYYDYPTITGYFGPATLAAVKKFQQAHNLDALGYVGPSTRALLNSGQPVTPNSSNPVSVPVFSRSLVLGQTGNDVRTLQQFLKDQGFFNHPSITGYFGAVTRSAVIAFQKALGINPNGVVGPATQGAIGNINFSSASNPSPSIPSTPNTPAPSQPQLPEIPVAYGPNLGTGGAPWGGGGGGDSESPTVSITAPANSAIVAGNSVTISATASDNVGVAGVQFKINGVNLGVEDVAAPYQLNWDSTSDIDGVKLISAVARDAAGNTATAAAVSVTADNTGPVISSISSGTPGATTATITWTTNESANSQVNYGLTSSYGSSTTLDATMVTSHTVNLTGLSGETTYHFRVRSTDAQGNLTVSADQTFSTVSAYSTESQAFFTRLSVQPNTARKEAYDTMIRSLVTGGVWSKLDALYIFAAANSSTALTNLVSSSYTATKEADAVFTADRGITGIPGCCVQAIDTGFNPTSAAGHYSLDSASVFAWSDNFLGQNRFIFSAGDPLVDLDRLSLYPRQANGLSDALINANSTLTYNKITDGGGLQALNRSSAANWNLYQRGINRATQTRASVAMPNSTIKFLGSSFSGNAAAGGFGGSLTGPEHLTLSNAIKTYLATIGAPTQTAAEFLNPDSLVKSDVDYYTSSIETTLLSFNGELITISFDHSGDHITVRSYPDGEILASKTWTNGGIYGSAINVGGIIHIFGTKLDGLSLVHSTLDSSFNPTAATEFYTAPDTDRFANTSVAYNGTKYIMSVEYLTSPIETFFLQSNDLSSWSSFGSPYVVPGDGYQGSPKLYYIDGVYYLTHLVAPEGNSAYYMKLAKSSNGNTWTTSTTDNTAVLLYPEFADGISASDLTLVEDGLGDVQGVWIDGSQDGLGNGRTLRYEDTTLKLLFESFFS